MSEERQAGRCDRAGFGETAGDALHEPAVAPSRAENRESAVSCGLPGALHDVEGRVAARRRRLAFWWRGASPNLRGSVYMFSAMLVYSVMVGAIKHVGGTIPLAQILLIRQIIMSVLIAAFAGAALPVLMRTERAGLQIMRALVTLISMLLGFTAMLRIPLAQATAIGFSSVLFVTIAAVLVLKERVDASRWIATIIGFCGVLIMLNPSTQGLDPFAVMAVAAAVFNAWITVSVRMLATTERTETILLYQGAVIITLLAVPVWWIWVAPSPEQWFWLMVLSVFGSAGQFLLTRAYQVGEAAALAPLDFSRLLLASFTGFVFFAEVPGFSTWLGAAIVVSATLYTVRRNARSMRDKVTAH